MVRHKIPSTRPHHYSQRKVRKGDMTNETARHLNRGLLTVALLALVIFGALLTPPISAAITYLLS